MPSYLQKKKKKTTTNTQITGLSLLWEIRSVTQRWCPLFLPCFISNTTRGRSKLLGRMMEVYLRRVRCFTLSAGWRVTPREAIFIVWRLAFTFYVPCIETMIMYKRNHHHKVFTTRRCSPLVATSDSISPGWEEGGLEVVVDGWMVVEDGGRGEYSVTSSVHIWAWSLHAAGNPLTGADEWGGGPRELPKCI